MRSINNIVAQQSIPVNAAEAVMPDNQGSKYQVRPEKPSESQIKGIDFLNSALAGSQRGSRTPTEASGIDKGNKGPGGPGPALISQDIRDCLLSLTGVDVFILKSYKPEMFPSKRRLWKFHGMRCDICGKTWDDGIHLNRHHKIPLRLCRYLGITKAQSWHESNIAVLCDDHHNLADEHIRDSLYIKFPGVWKCVKA